MAGPARQDLPLWKGSTLPGFLPRANEVIRAVNDLKDRAGLPGQVFTTRPRGGGDSGTWVRLSTYTATGKYYNGVLQVGNGVGGFSDASPVQNYTVFAVGNRVGIELGAIVLIRPNGTLTSSVGALPSGTAVYSFPFVEPRQSFEVDVTQNGGSNGNATTQASWTYDVKMVGTSNIISPSPLAPLYLGWRLGKGPVTAGTTGLASYTAAGVLRLLTVNEQHGNVPCGGS